MRRHRRHRLLRLVQEHLPTVSASGVLARLRALSLRDRVGPAALAVVLCSLAWTIISYGMADARARSNPTAALAWHGGHGLALLTEAENENTAAAEPAEIGAARETALAAVKAAPLEVRAVSLLGQVDERLGQTDRAAQIMELAGERNLRDWPTQAWLINRKAEEGDYATALTRADALLRAYPAARDQLIGLLLAEAGNPDSQPLLVKALVDRPPWREWFLGELGRRAPDDAATMFKMLRAENSAPSTAETKAYLGELVRTGAFGTAYLAWVQGLPPDEQLRLGTMVNGDFEAPPSGVPFDWTITRIAGAATEIRDAPARDGKALMVDFADQRVNYRNISEVLMLGPGKYTLAGFAKGEALDTPRGLVWRVACAATPDQPIAETQRFKGSFPWTEFRLSFEVPADGCRAQLLRLEVATRVVLDQNIAGRIWFDDFSVAPEGGE